MRRDIYALSRKTLFSQRCYFAMSSLYRVVYLVYLSVGQLGRKTFDRKASARKQLRKRFRQKFTWRIRGKGLVSCLPDPKPHIPPTPQNAFSFGLRTLPLALCGSLGYLDDNTISHLEYLMFLSDQTALHSSFHSFLLA